MLKLTKALREWLIANREIEQDAEDETFRLEVGKAIADGSLSVEEFSKLIRDEKVGEANEFAKRLERLDKMADSIEGLTKAMAIKEEEEKKVNLQVEDKTDGLKDVSKMIVENSTAQDGEHRSDVRLKTVKEIFSTTTKTMTYPSTDRRGERHRMAGQPVVVDGHRTLMEPSDLDKACAGAWAKFQIASVTPLLAGNPSLAWERLSETEKMLLDHLCKEGDWDATDRDGHPRMEKGYRGGTKQLIDDVISGGFEATPIVFDDQAIETPRLYGELYPLVNEIPLARGRRVEGVSVGTVTVAWGGVDATAIALFNTAGFVAAFDTTIYRCQGAVVIGLDFMSDSPIDFGSLITKQYGEQLLVSLDNVIATGNGTTQPQGIMNAAGTTVVAFGGTTTLGAYESLLFGVHKRELLPNVLSSYVFCGTDTSYSRARGLNVTAADQRRLGGGEAGQGDYRSYTWMGRPYKINESLTNQQIFCGVLANYQMYRRKGFTVRTSTEGDTLIRANELLIMFMARYGGQLKRGACAAVTNTAPA